MALNFIDSFAHSGVEDNTPPPIDVFNKWTNAGGTNGGFYVTSAANGGKGNGLGPVRASGYAIALIGDIWKTLNYVNYRVMGCAYYYESSSSKGFPLTMGSGGTTLVQLIIESDNTLSIYAGGNRIYNTGTAYVITSDVYHYLEMAVLLTGGIPIDCRVSVQVDGNLVIDDVIGSTGIDKSSLLSNDTSMNQVAIGGAEGGSETSYACDFYCLDANTNDIFGAETTNVNFLGDVSVYAIMPDADATVSWQASPSVAHHYTNVDEIPPDDDTTYVYTDTVGQVETFQFTPITGFTGTILGAQLLVYAKKDAEGTRAYRPAIAGASFGDSDSYLYDYYDYAIWPMDTNNGTPWTPANFNSQNFGAVLTI